MYYICINLALNIVSVVSTVDVCDWFLQVHDNITYHYIQSVRWYCVCLHQLKYIATLTK